MPPLQVRRLEQEVTIINGVRGAGMTLSSGLRDQLINSSSKFMIEDQPN